MIDRIARIQTTVENLRSNPMGPFAPNNLAVLLSDLRQIDTGDTRKALDGHTHAEDVTNLQDFIGLAKIAQTLIATSTLHEFTLSLRTPVWDSMMDRVSVSMSRMPCGVSVSRTPGDTEGRELQGTQAEPATVTQDDTPIENVEEIAFGTLIAAVIALIIGRYATRLIQQKLILRRRRSKRFTVHIDTVLHVNGQTFNAEIIDISCEGAKLRYWHDTELDHDTVAGIELSGVTYEGHRAWSNPHYFGIRFTKPLAIKMVRDLVNANAVDGLGRPKKKTKKAATA